MTTVEAPTSVVPRGSLLEAAAITNGFSRPSTNAENPVKACNVKIAVEAHSDLVEAVNESSTEEISAHTIGAEARLDEDKSATSVVVAEETDLTTTATTSRSTGDVGSSALQSGAGSSMLNDPPNVAAGSDGREGTAVEEQRGTEGAQAPMNGTCSSSDVEGNGNVAQVRKRRKVGDQNGRVAWCSNSDQLILWVCRCLRNRMLPSASRRRT